MERLNNEAVGNLSIAPDRRIEMDYPDAMLRLWRFADEDSVRFALGFVKLDFANGRVEATNGRIACRHAVAFDDSFVRLSPVLLYRNDLRRVAKFFSTSRYRGLRLVNEGESWYAENSESRLVLQTDDGRFPDTDPIFAIKPERAVKFALSAKQLRRLCHAYDSPYGEEIPLEFSVPLDGKSVVSIKSRSAVEVRLMVMGDSDDGQSIVVEPAIESP